MKKLLLIFVFIEAFFCTQVFTKPLSSCDKNQLIVSRAFGGWSVCKELFDLMLEVLPKGSILLEFGSGWTSQEFSKYYTVYSIEHNQKWIGSYNTNYIYVPIAGRWYNVNILKQKLPTTYDIILIDGPPGAPGASTGRYGFFHNKELFNLDVPILIDDVHRATELKLLKDLSNYVNRPYVIYQCGNKAFGYISNLK